MDSNAGVDCVQGTNHGFIEDTFTEPKQQISYQNTTQTRVKVSLPYHSDAIKKEDLSVNDSTLLLADNEPSSPQRYSREPDRPIYSSERRSDSPSSFVANMDGTVNEVDDATKAAIAAAQNEHGTRVRATKGTHGSDHSNRNSSPLGQSPVPSLPKQAQRSKPSGSSAKKPATKKRRLNHDTPSGSVQRSPISATPRSASPTNIIASDDVSERDSEIDDSEVYCICRRPDDHTWMIACDGCEDWFHGKCVNIPKEDEGLVDNFFCPSCDLQAKGHTTWKPVCRYGPCRNSARLKRGQESKYCSDACGDAFMKEQMKRTEQLSALSRKKRNVGLDSDMDLGPLGGSLRLPEAKALARAPSTVENFQKLGSMAAITPPPSVVTEEEMPDACDNNESAFTQADLQRFNEIKLQKEALRHRRALLKEKELFVTMVKDRAKKAADAAKVKEQCGFDSRLSWDDQQFERWRYSKDGEAAFGREELCDSNDVDQLTEGLCTRRRCNRHSGWQKLAVHDVRFEEADGVDEMRKIDTEEQSIRLRAARRAPSGSDDLDAGSVEIIT